MFRKRRGCQKPQLKRGCRSCLTIDVVFTIAAKTERDIVGSIVTTVENVENTKLPCLEKEQVVVEVTMSDVACNHDVTMLNVID